jgi:thiol-disulfide isomerase/thioredoxin
MKYRILMCVCLIISIFTLTACSKNDSTDNSAAVSFKEEYESLNGTTNESGKEHRTITIDEDNPYVKVSADKIVEMIENKETFYVYFGANWCPWCRSVLEKSIEVDKDNNIKTIYYVDITDIRDTLEYVDKKIETTQSGSDAYYKLIELLDNVLDDYTLYDGNNKEVETNEKRIYAPNFIYVKNGNAVKKISAISEAQTDSRETLTDEILNDEEKAFDEFFKLSK